MNRESLKGALIAYDLFLFEKQGRDDQFSDDLVEAFLSEYEEKNPKLFEFDFKPPSTREALNYIVTKKLMPNKTMNELEDVSEMFVNYYEMVGWVVGKQKTKMIRWSKALSNWCKRDWNNATTKNRVKESVRAYMLLQESKRH